MKNSNMLQQVLFGSFKPIGSMYGIFTYIWLIFMVNVGKYTSPMDPMGNSKQNKMFSRVGGVFLSQTSILEAIVIYEAAQRIMGSQVPGGLEIPPRTLLYRVKPLHRRIP